MSRLAIDPSEIHIPDYAEIKRRLWSRLPSHRPEDTPPVVKVVDVDFSDETAPVVVQRPIKLPQRALPKREKPSPPAKLVNVVKLYRVAYVSPGACRRPLQQILEAVARIHHVSADNLTGRNLDKRLCDARQHAYYAIATERRDISYPEIARRFSDRHHTTIIYGAAAFSARHGLPPVVRS